MQLTNEHFNVPFASGSSLVRVVLVFRLMWVGFFGRWKMRSPVVSSVHCNRIMTEFHEWNPSLTHLTAKIQAHLLPYNAQAMRIPECQ